MVCCVVRFKYFRHSLFVAEHRILINPHISEDDVQGQLATTGKNFKPAAGKSPAKKGTGLWFDGKSGGKALGLFHVCLQQAKTTATKTQNS